MAGGLVPKEWYVETNVYDMAKQRLHHIYEIFDSVVVSFSGGKDSLAALHLAQEVRLERGLDGPLDVLFYDEELIPDPVLDFVEEYRRKDWVRLLYLAVPIRSTKFVLGETSTLIQWDPEREWIRPKPEHAVKEIEGWQAGPQNELNGILPRFYPGKIAMVNGIRATESHTRFWSCINKLSENYINASVDPRVKLCKPVYDWEENDVFRYFFEQGIRYCPFYDAQLWGQVKELRVSTPTHAEKAKRIGEFRTCAPMFYEQILRLFPEMGAQERYYRELDRSKLIEQYGEDFDAIARFIEERIPEGQQRDMARRRFAGICKAAAARPSAYPARYVFRYFLAGSFKRNLLPMSGGKK